MKTKTPQGTANKKCKLLRKIYLSVHALPWIGVGADDPRRRDPAWEQWPGRCETCQALDLELRLRIYQAIRGIQADEGLFILPSAGIPANAEMSAYARRLLGPRAVVCDFDYDRAVFLKALGSDFERGLAEDRRRALRFRAAGVSDAQFDNEMAAWERSKAWALNLRRQLESRGHAFDPATVDLVSWGADWCGCAATYPIQMGRAWGLAKPIERRWDLTIRDCCRRYVEATLVVQNIAMPEHIRLYIFRGANGRYYADYWEGLHCPMEPRHVVTLDFPAGAVRRLGEKRAGRRVTVKVGCGGHVQSATVIEASRHFHLDDFHNVLTRGRVAPAQRLA